MHIKEYGVISSDFIERGFRNVDRKYFVPKDNEDSAYSDQPLKEGHVHISAPHIYGSALEALELQPNSSLSFCNIGSGTGYLSCIVAEALGPKSVNYGIEIFPEVVEHCNASINEWKTSDSFIRNHPKHFAHLQIVHGNALNVSNKGESVVGFDRIYIGASVDKSNLPHITKLLSPGGILVGPVDDELVKIVRIGRLSQHGHNTGSAMSYASSTSDDESVDDDPHPSGTNDNNEFTQQILSGVRFASLVNLPAKETVLPSRLWTPNLQQFFPDSFQNASMELLLCSNSKYVQPLPPPKTIESRVNLAAVLPRVIWLEILSYTHRRWFDSKESETEFLKKRLLEEQANAAKARQALEDAEARCQVAQRERDVYRLLARRWQSRLQLVLQQQRDLVESGPAPNLPQILSPNETNDNPEREESSSADASLVALLPQVRNYSTDLEEEAENAALYDQESNSSMEEDDEERADNAMIVHEDHQQLLEFLNQHQNDNSDDEEYDFHSLYSSDHNNNQVAEPNVAILRNNIEQEQGGDDNESVTMDDASVLSEDNSHYIAQGSDYVSKSESSSSPHIHQNREIRTISMCSDDL